MRRCVCLLWICLTFRQVYLSLTACYWKFFLLHYIQVLCQYRLCKADHAYSEPLNSSHGKHCLLLSCIVLDIFTAPLHSNGHGMDHIENILSIARAFTAGMCLLSCCLAMGIHITIYRQSKNKKDNIILQTWPNLMQREQTQLTWLWKWSTKSRNISNSLIESIQVTDNWQSLHL
jgi:hypothetical protein